MSDDGQVMTSVCVMNEWIWVRDLVSGTNCECVSCVSVNANSRNICKSCTTFFN
jgi:hypothetical protein